MSDIPLARKYRPKSLKEVIGQEVVVKSVVNAFKSDKLHQAYIFAGKYGCGKCVDGDTLVVTTNGLRRIKDLVPFGTTISRIDLAVPDESGIGVSEYGYWEADADTLELTTQGGFSLVATPEHKIRVLSPSGCIEWKRAGNIRIGDAVVIVRKEQITEHQAPEVNFTFDRETYACAEHSVIANQKNCLRSLKGFVTSFKADGQFARFLGYAISEGHLSSQFSLSNTDNDVIDDVVGFLNRLGLEPSVGIDCRRESLQHVSCGVTGFVQWLSLLGLQKLSCDKRLPDIVLSFPRSLMVEFLRAYFEGDGGVDGRRVSVWSCSKLLLQDIQRVLLSMGIVSGLSEKPTTCSNCKRIGRFQSYKLSISGESLELFSQKIGFVSDRKNKQMLSIVSTRHNPNKDVIPYWKERLLLLRSRLPISQNGMVKTAQGWLRSPVRWNSNLNKPNYRLTYQSARQVVHYFNRIAELLSDTSFAREISFEISILNDILSKNYYYDIVTSVAYSGKRDVFDLSKLASDHSFYANGFINHNTSTARILAAMENCEKGRTLEPCGECDNCKAIFEGKSLDVKEIDAASSGSIDGIRQLREEIRYAPQDCRKKYVILDEVHRLSGAAAEASLKMIEEPPAHVRFILCTTDPQLLKNTIHSRCLKLYFNKVHWSVIFEHLKDIANREGVQYEEDALRIASTSADGSVRNSLQNLQTLIDFCGSEKLSAAAASQVLGAIGDKVYFEMLHAVNGCDANKALQVVDKLFLDGRQAGEISEGLYRHLRNLMLAIVSKDNFANFGFTTEDAKRYHFQADQLKLKVILDLMELVKDINRGLMFNMDPQQKFEEFVVRAIIAKKVFADAKAKPSPQQK